MTKILEVALEWRSKPPMAEHQGFEKSQQEGMHCVSIQDEILASMSGRKSSWQTRVVNGEAFQIAREPKSTLCSAKLHR